MVASLVAGGLAHAGPVVPALARPQDEARFRITTFASGLAFPTSMAGLADGSLLVGTSSGGTSWASNYLFASPSGALVRLVDADHDGVADGPPQVMAAGLPGIVSSVRRVGGLVFATSAQGGAEAITILRTGSSADTPLSVAGRLSFSFPAGFSHSTYALAARVGPGGAVELYFNVGARGNDVSTPANVTVGLTPGLGAAFASGPGSAALAADAIHRVVITDSGSSISVSAPRQIASGLRNAAGMTFDPAGNLYLQDNGLDGPGGASLSADELNMIPAADVGAVVPDFGFAATYVDYATGATVGPTAGITAPLAVFRPLAGEKSEGAVELAFAPASFPSEFAGGLFVPFSGKFNQGGVNNDENPFVFVDPATGGTFHFIANQTMGHPNGVLATADALYLSDLNFTGAFYGSVDGVPADQGGVIYRIVAVPEPTAGLLLVLGFVALLIGPLLRRGVATAIDQADYALLPLPASPLVFKTGDNPRRLRPMRIPRRFLRLAAVLAALTSGERALLAAEAAAPPTPRAVVRAMNVLAAGDLPMPAAASAACDGGLPRDLERLLPLVPRPHRGLVAECVSGRVTILENRAGFNLVGLIDAPAADAAAVATVRSFCDARSVDVALGGGWSDDAYPFGFDWVLVLDRESRRLYSFILNCHD